MRSLICGLLLMLAATPAAGDILNVPADYPTIQAAIDAAQHGDEIVLAPGTYESPGIVIDRSLTVTIRSIDPADPAVAAATVLFDPDDDTLITLVSASPTPSLLTLDGVTISRGAVRSASSIVSTGVPIMVSRCLLLAAGPSGTQPRMITVEIDAEPDDPDPIQIVDSAITGNHGILIDLDHGSMTLDRILVTQSDVRFIAPDTLRVLRSRFENVYSINLLRGSSVEIEDCVVTDSSGAVSESPGSVRAERLRIERHAVNAGVIGCREGVFIDCEILECSADPGLHWIISAERLQAIDCTFVNNVGPTPLHATNRFPTDSYLIEGCTFENNLTLSGALDAHGTGIIRDSVFRNNRIGDDTGFTNFAYGGAITVWSTIGPGSGGRPYAGQFLVDRCTFIGNHANSGGAVYVAPSVDVGASIMLKDSMFAANSAFLGGVLSAFHFDPLGPGEILLDQCVLIGNRADHGALHAGNAIYVGCSIAENHAGEGQLAATLFSFANDPTGTLINSIFLPKTPGPLLVRDGGTGIGEPVFDHVITTDLLQSATNTTTLNPLFIRPPSDGGDGWGDDPATPDTDESLNDDFGDLRLRPGSPAIDAGTNDFYTPGDTDLDGGPRLADDPGVPGISVDIGAYEFQGVTCLPDVNQNGVVAPDDFSAWIIAYNDNSPLADQNRDGEVAPDDFNAWILNYGLGCP